MELQTATDLHAVIIALNIYKHFFIDTEFYLKKKNKKKFILIINTVTFKLRTQNGVIH